MRKIVYYVATSLDGYIAGEQDDVSQFIAEGPGVQQYLEDLQGFDTVVMGRRTYEFGYQYGLQPGQPAYPHMKHLIVSRRLQFDQPHEQVRVVPPDIDFFKRLKRTAGSDIYLCGGGQLAGLLMQHHLIDEVKLKLNPIVLGTGIPLFGALAQPARFSLLDQQVFGDGMQILRYGVRNGFQISYEGI